MLIYQQETSPPVDLAEMTRNIAQSKQIISSWNANVTNIVEYTVPTK